MSWPEGNLSWLRRGYVEDISMKYDRTILYLAPPSRSKNGIADYADSYQEAVETYTDWQFRRLDGENIIYGESLRDLLKIRRKVKQWQTDGTLRGVKFIHAEIGYKQQDLFYILFWLNRLYPTLPYCITVHDPPLVLAPALKPLCFGMKANSVRRACRLLDYTPLARGVVHSVLKQASDLFVLSHRGRSVLQSTLGTKASVSWLPFLNYRRTRPLASSRQKRSPITILFSGFWGQGKGIEILIRAMEMIQTHRPDAARLWMTGGAEQSPASQRYAATVTKRIHESSAKSIIDIRGYIAWDAIDTTFESAQIFALPTISRSGYSASSVLFRAMAAGLAIVASDVGMMGEEIRSQETGLLVPSGDANALSEALLSLIDSPELRAHVGWQALEHAFNEHGQEAVAHQAATYYNQILTARP